jgi:hypothetical protein
VVGNEAKLKQSEHTAVQRQEVMMRWMDRKPMSYISHRHHGGSFRERKRTK